MANLPLDIISEVLLRLPIKSIGRFRCVSKPWLCLISESRFVKKHLHRSISNTSDGDDNTRIIVSDGCKIMLINPSQLEPRDYINDAPCKMVDIDLPLLGLSSFGLYIGSLEGSCHGLVLIRVNANIFVCNPCTRDVRELPKLNYTPINNDVFFNGIGYDSSSDDYKVLIDGNVFSFKSNSWKTPTHNPGESCGCLKTSGVFFDGCIHWIVMRNFKDEIVSFDLATEQYLELPHLPLPPEPEPEHDGDVYYKLLFVTGTYLSLFLYGHELEKHEVWVLKEQGDEFAWTKSYVVVYGHYYDKVFPVCLLKSGELLLHADKFFLALYNPKDGTTRKFYPGDYIIYFAFGYIESLVSPYRLHDTGLGEQ